MTYDCMTTDELTLWLESEWTGRGPCQDCLAWFEEMARDKGVCRRRADPVRRERMRGYSRARKA